MKNGLMLHNSFLVKFISLLPFLGLMACSNHSDLDKWMKEQRDSAAESYKKSHQVVDYGPSKVSYHYVLENISAIQPFSDLKMRMYNFSRSDGRKGILENYDLSEMKYVGYLKSASKIKGFIHINDQVYTVYYGTPIGKDFGKIISISPQKIVIRENIENFEGLWIGRNAELEMFKDK